MATEMRTRIFSYLSNHDAFRHASSGNYSLAARRLHDWIQAFIAYEKVQLALEPDQNKTESEGINSKDKENRLKSTKDRMRDLRDMIDSLGEDKTETDREMTRLRELMNEVAEKVKRRNTLLELLASKKVEWEASMQKLREAGDLAIGDAFMNAMYFAFLSPFPPPMRKAIVAQTLEKAKELGIPISSDYSFVRSSIEESTFDEFHTLKG
jgi:type I site-specific restriction-modification system R (restriction) subunit